jgi:hypothetical protein
VLPTESLPNVVKLDLLLLLLCRWEDATLAQGGKVTRPVVRLELGGRPVIITRIQPQMRNTSMLIRCVCFGGWGQ